MDQRYYNDAGRFFSPDPGGLNTADSSNPGSWNRYGYAYGDPINFIDPSGLFACRPEICDPEPKEPFCDANPGAPECQGPNGSGAAPNSGLGLINVNLLNASQTRVAGDLLNKPDCAKDFKSVPKTDSKLSKLSFKNYGEATVNGGPSATPSGGQLGQYNPITGRITLNSSSSVNWTDPTKSFWLVNGTQTPEDFIAGELNFLGLPLNTPMTAGQFMDLIVLHELAHYDGTVGNPDISANELKLWNDCVRQ